MTNVLKNILLGALVIAAAITVASLAPLFYSDATSALVGAQVNSVEVQFAEVSPNGTNGGYAVPASGGSNTCTLTITPSSMTVGSGDVTLVGSNAGEVQQMQVYRDGVQIGTVNQGVGFVDTAASNLSAGVYEYEMRGSYIHAPYNTVNHQYTYICTAPLVIEEPTPLTSARCGYEAQNEDGEWVRYYNYPAGQTRVFVHGIVGGDGSYSYQVTDSDGNQNSGSFDTDDLIADSWGRSGFPVAYFTYTDGGTKSATVELTSDGETVEASCSAVFLSGDSTPSDDDEVTPSEPTPDTETSVGGPNLTCAPPIVRMGDTAVCEWETFEPGCTLSGGSLSAYPASEGRGRAPVTINGLTNMLLSCPNGGTDTATIRALPRIQET